MLTLNTEKYLVSDDATAEFKTLEEFNSYLDFRMRNDEWFSVYINELACYGILNEPMFIPSNCRDIVISKKNYNINVEDINFNSEPVKECIGTTGIFLVIPYQNKMVAFPTRHLAIPSICQRADDFCGTMTRFESKPNKAILSVVRKAERLTEDFCLYSDLCQILYRDGKISAAHSKDYAILPARELIDALTEVVTSEHPNLEFKSGSATHEFLVAEYLLNDRLNEESLRLKLNDSGCNISNLRAGIRFYTSDVASSSVFVKYVLYIDGTSVLLDGIQMKHIGDSSIELFREELTTLGRSISECEQRIEELGMMDIADVAAVVKAVTVKYTALFPFKISEEVIEESKVKYAAGGTGIDVYLCLTEIVERNAKNTSLANYLKATESCAKLLYLEFDKITEE